MADVQRPSWIGRHKLHQYFLLFTRCAAVCITLLRDEGQHGAAGSVRQSEINKAGARELGLRNNGCSDRVAHQGIDDRLCQFARITFRRFGKLHRDVSR